MANDKDAAAQVAVIAGLAMLLLDDASMLFDQHKLRSEGWRRRLDLLRDYAGPAGLDELCRLGIDVTAGGWNTRTIPPAK